MSDFLRSAGVAALLSGLVSGIPSTFYKVVSGASWRDSFDAVASMANAGHLDFGWRFGIAVVIHFVISFAWAVVLIRLLPRQRAVLWGAAAGAAIAVLDLRVVAPVFFSEVAALAFWPQLADHIVWGAVVGGCRSRMSRSRSGK